ncbi:hypothetical protein ABZT17_10030 [Streptomyces sp. NPDC005648]|uniref:hypothetical protein n=1 Tax=Streptomyces sp. NPDC005648 TaxID=3157044 RepID=UPI0033B826E7
MRAGDAGDVRLEPVAAVGAALDELCSRGRSGGRLALRTHRLVAADEVPVVDEGFAVERGHVGEGAAAALAAGVQRVDALLDLGLEGAAEVRDASHGLLDNDLGCDDPGVGVLGRGGGTGRGLVGHVLVSP